MKEATLSASDAKATFFDVLERLSSRELERVTITKRGRPVAVLAAMAGEEAQARAWLASMRGGVVIPEGADLTEPAFDGVMDAELGILHR